jgi:hypothetical protein
MIAPTEEEWIAWREHPVTRFVNEGLLMIAHRAKEAWQETAWVSPPTAGERDLVSRELDRQRAMIRAEAYTDLANLKLEDARGANGLEPKEATDG